MRGLFIAQKDNQAFRRLTGIISFLLTFSLIFTPVASYAQAVNFLNLPVPGTMIAPSPAFVPVLLKGMTIYPEDPLKFDFIIDSGTTAFTADEVKMESEKLVKYFLASMTIPKDDLWVNLSPYESDRIIPEELGKTELGRDMLAQDYILKQLTASLMYPEKELGKKFWDKIYQRAEEELGTSEIPVNTFNKVWILPETATVYEHEQTVYVVNARLKVMLDSDYEAMQNANVGTQHAASLRDKLSEQIIREIIIPEIEREVNEGAHFAPLRQIYHSLILAKWYKQTVKNSLLSQVYADKNMIDGIESEEKDVKEQVYAQYMEAYKKGVFNYIKEDYDRLSHEVIPRKYFSGGLELTSSPVEIKNVYSKESVRGFNGGGWIATAKVIRQIDESSSPVELKEGERTATTITLEDFAELVKLRQEGKVGFHKNVDSRPVVPALKTDVLTWNDMDDRERNRLKERQDEMYHEGKIAPGVMIGGEATRFGGPKTFVKVSDDLGDFLEIKAANLRWLQETSGAKVPLYLLSSEKRLVEFKQALKERNYYGMTPEDFQFYVQGTVNTFIPTDEEIEANFKGSDIEKYKAFAAAIRAKNPDGIYRFQGEERKVPPGHFDAISSFIISGRFSEALAQGVEIMPIFNIDNLQAVLKNDGVIAHFAENNLDFAFLLAEKNLTFTITRKGVTEPVTLFVRFLENVISFDGIKEFEGQAEKDGVRYVINQKDKTIDVLDIATNQRIITDQKIKPETGGTLVQPVDEQGRPFGIPVMKEGFELPSGFDHANSPYFNTNTIIVRLRSLLKLLGVTEEILNRMSFEERSALVRERLVKQIKANFEFKKHIVEGEFPELGPVKDGKTEILVSQVTRIMLQVAHIEGAHVAYYNFPRREIFAPVKEPEDKPIAAANNRESLKKVTKYVVSSPVFEKKSLEEILRAVNPYDGQVFQAVDLDAGMGTFLGRIEPIIKKILPHTSFDGVSVESSPYFSQKANEERKRRGLNGNRVLNAVPEDYRDLDLKDKSFDLVTVNHPIQRFVLIDQAVRLVNEGGLIIVALSDSDVDDGVHESIQRDFLNRGLESEIISVPEDYPATDIDGLKEKALVVARKPLYWEIAQPSVGNNFDSSKLSSPVSKKQDEAIGAFIDAFESSNKNMEEAIQSLNPKDLGSVAKMLEKIEPSLTKLADDLDRLRNSDNMRGNVEFAVGDVFGNTLQMLFNIKSLLDLCVKEKYDITDDISDLETIFTRHVEQFNNFKLIVKHVERIESEIEFYHGFSEFINIDKLPGLSPGAAENDPASSPVGITKTTTDQLIEQLWSIPVNYERDFIRKIEDLGMNQEPDASKALKSLVPFLANKSRDIRYAAARAAKNLGFTEDQFLRAYQRILLLELAPQEVLDEARRAVQHSSTLHASSSPVSSSQDEAVNILIKKLEVLGNGIANQFEAIDQKFSVEALLKLRDLVDDHINAMRDLEAGRSGVVDHDVAVAVVDILGNSIVPIKLFVSAGSTADDIPYLKHIHEKYQEQFGNFKLIVKSGELSDISSYYYPGRFVNMEKLQNQSSSPVEDAEGKPWYEEDLFSGSWNNVALAARAIGDLDLQEERERVHYVQLLLGRLLELKDDPFTHRSIVNAAKKLGATDDQINAASGNNVSGSSPVTADEEVGGIDLNDIEVDHQGGGVSIQFDPVAVQEILDMGITGFAPVIINITPLPSVLPLLGLAPQREEEYELSKS